MISALHLTSTTLDQNRAPNSGPSTSSSDSPYTTCLRLSYTKCVCCYIRYSRNLVRNKSKKKSRKIGMHQPKITQGLSIASPRFRIWAPAQRSATSPTSGFAKKQNFLQLTQRISWHSTTSLISIAAVQKAHYALAWKSYKHIAYSLQPCFCSACHWTRLSISRLISMLVQLFSTDS